MTAEDLKPSFSGSSGVNNKFASATITSAGFNF